MHPAGQQLGGAGDVTALVRAQKGNQLRYFFGQSVAA
jgi:hypothetical protein